jgi:hypothetical protein
MDDLEVIRFLAMDIITNPDYHVFPQKKSPFFARLFTDTRPYQSRCSHPNKFTFTMAAACREWSVRPPTQRPLSLYVDKGSRTPRCFFLTILPQAYILVGFVPSSI